MSPTITGNVQVYERIALNPRQTGSTLHGAPVFAPGMEREKAKKMLQDRIEAGKKKFGAQGANGWEDAELVESSVQEKEGWMCSAAVYASRQERPMILRAVVNADGSAEGY